MAASMFTAVLKRILVDPDNAILWQQFLMFTYCCFGVSERGGKRHKTTLANSKVNNAFSNFLLTNSQTPLPSRQSKNRRIDESKTGSMSAKIKESDVRGAVRLAVSYDTLAPCSDDAADALRLLHSLFHRRQHRLTVLLYLNLLPFRSTVLSRKTFCG